MCVLWKMMDCADFLYCPHQQSEAERELAVPATCPVRRSKNKMLHVWSEERKLVLVPQHAPQ